MKDFTDITVLLDRSGSMGIVKNDVIGGFNGFIKDQKKAGSNAALTLVQFDTGGIDYVHEAVPIKKAEKLTGESYQPRGGTPLLDALGSTINKTGERLAAMPEDERPDKVVFVIMTDGEENSSHEFTKAMVRDLIEQQNRDYNWQFVYLGANQDAFAEAGTLGINLGTVANYTVNNIGSTYSVTSSNIADWRTTDSVASLTYTAEQRKELVGK